MTEQDAIQELSVIADKLETKPGYDEEPAHAEADEVLIEFLKANGYAKLAEAYDSIPKWFA